MAKTIYEEGEFMKPFKLFIILSIVFVIFVTPLGCASEPSYTDSEREQDQKEINDYLKELREWEDYTAEYGNNVSLLVEELIDLANKRAEATEAEDLCPF